MCLISKENSSIDTPWIDIGFDSLSSTELVSTLNTDFGNILQLSPTSLFDYPTPNKLIEHVHDKLFGETHTSSTQIVYKERKIEPIAIVGIACDFPGNSNTPEKFWQNLIEKKKLCI